MPPGFEVPPGFEKTCRIDVNSSSLPSFFMFSPCFPRFFAGLDFVVAHPRAVLEDKGGSSERFRLVVPLDQKTNEGNWFGQLSPNPKTLKRYRKVGLVKATPL